jgi:hypothetical protein
MIVKKLTWLSESALEAILIISDGEYEAVAFSCPCSLKEGDILTEPLFAMSVDNLMYSYETRYAINLIKPEGLHQQCVALVVDLQKQLVKIGEIYIELDCLIPTEVDNYVEFYCGRLDVI